MNKEQKFTKANRPLICEARTSFATWPFRSIKNGLIFTGLCVIAFLAGVGAGNLLSPAAAEESYASIPPELEVYYAPIPEVKIPSIKVKNQDPLSYKAFEKHDLTDIDETPEDALKHIKEDAVTFIIGHYKKVTRETAEEIVEQAFIKGKKYNVDPLLILAIIASESSFNPNSKSSAGAAGLMQVHLKVHSKRFKKYGGVEAAYEIEPGIEEGTRILKDYLAKAGTLTGALKYYVGAANNSTDGGYARKVLSMRKNLQLAVAGDVEAAHIRARAPSRMPLDLTNKVTHATYEHGLNIERVDGLLKTANAQDAKGVSSQDSEV